MATMRVNVIALMWCSETLTWISGYQSCTRDGGGSLDLASEEHGGNGKGKCSNAIEDLGVKVGLLFVIVVMWFELG